VEKTRTLAANMSVVFNIDGQQLNRFLKHNIPSVQIFIESILIHDEIIIPIQDYLSLAALIHLLGEPAVLQLLELGCLKFVRLKGMLGYFRGSEEDGNLLALGTLGKKAFDATRTEAINAAFSVLSTSLENHKLLLDLAIQATNEMEMSSIVGEIREEAYADLQNTSLWHDSYSLGDTQLKKLPGLEPMSVRTLGLGSNPEKDVIDGLLSIALANIELCLAQKLNCIDSSTASPIGHILKIKAKRILPTIESAEAFTYLREITNIPNIGGAVLEDRSLFQKILNLRESRNGEQFRQWFHANSRSDEKTLATEYIKLLHDIPLIQSKKSRVMRFVVTSSIGAIPGIGTLLGIGAGAVDSFFIENWLKGNSPKFFIDDLRRFKGLSKGFGTKKEKSRKK